jgi:hypothetical protein
MAGDRSVLIEPDDRYSVSVAPGIFYSFVKAPKFAASQKGGQLVISQTTNDDNAISGMVALNVTLKELAGHSFTPVIQFGAAPDKDKLAFVLGAGFTSTTNISLTMGIVYQKTNQLQSGLSVGQVISSPNDLVTETRFKTGFYISSSYEFKIAK